MSVPRIAREQHATRLSGSEPEKPRTGRRTAHDAIHNDNRCWPSGTRFLQKICHTKTAPVTQTLFFCQLSRVRLIGGHQFHNLSLASAAREELGLDHANAATNLENSSAFEFIGGDARHHQSFDDPKSLLPVLLEIFSRDP